MRRRLVYGFGAVLSCAAMAAGGYVWGSSQGENIELAKKEGARAGELDGTRKGTREGRRLGKQRGFHSTFDDAFRRSFKKGYAAAFREFHLPEPDPGTIPVAR
jgi:hypothetical protein